MSLNQLLETGRRSLRASSTAMAIAGENVANASNPGYARRRLVADAGSGPTTGLHFRSTTAGLGGAMSWRTEPVQDPLYRSARLSAETGTAGADERARVLDAVEGLFGTDGKTLNDALHTFWDRLEDAAANPTDTSLRQTVLGAAGSVAGTLRRLANGAEALAGETKAALSGGVDEANRLLTEIASLNGKIQTARSGEAPDLAAEDRRAEAIRSLAALTSVTTSEGPDGLTITSGGLVLVQGGHAGRLTVTAEADGPPTVTLGETGVALGTSGKLGAWTTLLGTTIPETRAALDTLAADLATEVNAQHAAAYGLDGGTGRALFAGSNAASLRVALTDPRHLALTTAADRPAAADVALTLAALRGRFDGAAAGIVTNVGEAVRTARAEGEAQGAVLAHTTALEQSVSGGVRGRGACPSSPAPS